MSSLVNLRLFRKRRERETAALKAAENRARHGRPKAEKRLDRAEAEKASLFIEGHRLSRPRDDEA